MAARQGQAQAAEIDSGQFSQRVAYRALPHSGAQAAVGAGGQGVQRIAPSLSMDLQEQRAFVRRRFGLMRHLRQIAGP